MSLQDWLNNRWLEKHQTSSQEIADLLSIAKRDLADCQISELSPDWKMNIAYNAALQIATIALAASGYRAAREVHHSDYSVTCLYNKCRCRINHFIRSIPQEEKYQRIRLCGYDIQSRSQ